MKIKGFTLLELLLVMALSGMTVSIGWVVYQNMQQYWQISREKIEQTSREVLLDRTKRMEESRAPVAFHIDKNLPPRKNTKLFNSE